MKPVAPTVARRSTSRRHRPSITLREASRTSLTAQARRNGSTFRSIRRTQATPGGPRSKWQAAILESRGKSGRGRAPSASPQATQKRLADAAPNSPVWHPRQGPLRSLTNGLPSRTNVSTRRKRTSVIFSSSSGADDVPRSAQRESVVRYFGAGATRHPSKKRLSTALLCPSHPP